MRINVKVLNKTHHSLHGSLLLTKIWKSKHLNPLVSTELERGKIPSAFSDEHLKNCTQNGKWYNLRCYLTGLLFLVTIHQKGNLGAE
jgi:hypothetical protein